ncbi:MAG: imidazole glycerol phosphate synthase subunit HisF [Bacteroidetes bacterium]|nr:MAG: imidazole glycerol phosphate synthase subunit HisF [Bacteroidota bacterium]
MLTKRIIPCLDIKDGKTVKGVNFENLRDAGDPVELAQIYANEGADELVFLDITATVEKRKTLADLVKRVAQVINIPFTVGGGISSIEDASILLANGADKVSINSSAVKNPKLISDLAKEFGCQFVTVAIDTRFVNENHFVHTHGGRQLINLETIWWSKEVENLGAGEILLTSMDHDGVKNGFANQLTSIISTNGNIPVIASGGAGNMEHFKDVFSQGKADAALAASIFHFKEISIPDLKKYLAQEKIHVRI